ncbi:hypothetical protein J4439_02510 [Candidatus Woesearchaeota archaeon]|nr:hypothetical protein [Candidatus Woesearchaeota archaeon]
MAQVNIWLDAMTHRKAKALAAMQGTTLSELFRSAVTSSVERDKRHVRQMLQ